MQSPTLLREGYIYKKPEKKSFLWKKRWCVLYDTETSLYYYESQDKAKRGIIKGKIPFSSIHSWDGKPNGFQFYTPSNKVYRVYCDTLEETESWMNDMQSQLDKAPEKPDGEYVLHANLKPEPNLSNRSDSWKGEEMISNISFMEELGDVRSELSSLRAEVMAYRELEKEYKVQGRERSLSTLADGTMVEISASEMETMRQIFNLFDTKGTGMISANDLHKLHAKLGEPISPEDAAEAMKFMKQDQEKLDFQTFLKWWHIDHRGNDPDERMKRYQAKFKFLKARIANPNVGLIETRATGNFPSFEFRLNYFYGKDGQQISPWHDISLYNSDGTVNFICEIPKWTRKKMEIATGEPYNPIKQDTKNGKLREYTWGDMMFNYGAMPQTWEDPEHITDGTGCKGDNDPIDVVEIGVKQWPIGAVVRVKVLGVLALIDSGETDWKVICINVEDPFAKDIHDVADVEAHMPGCIAAIHDWLRDYKMPKINEYGYDGKCLNRDFAESIISETHEFWKQLIEERGGMATV